MPIKRQGKTKRFYVNYSVEFLWNSMEFHVVQRITSKTATTKTAVDSTAALKNDREYTRNDRIAVAITRPITLCIDNEYLHSSGKF